MTQQEILNLNNLKIAEVKPNMFLHIHAEDGYRITTWNDGDDIKRYVGSVCMYMPIREDYDGTYRVITVAEHEALETACKEAHEVEYEKNMQENNNR